MRPRLAFASGAAAAFLAALTLSACGGGTPTGISEIQAIQAGHVQICDQAGRFIQMSRFQKVLRRLEGCHPITQ